MTHDEIKKDCERKAKQVLLDYEECAKASVYVNVNNREGHEDTCDREFIRLVAQALLSEHLIVQKRVDALIDEGLGWENRLMLVFKDGKRLSVGKRLEQIEGLQKQIDELTHEIDRLKDKDITNYDLRKQVDELTKENQQLKE